MRGMNTASVDLIYLDPPFNSKANYAAPIGSKAAGAAFKDTWGLDDVNLAWHGEIKHGHPGLYALLVATRQIHGDSMMSYLIYMAIRVMEMRRILKPTGSMYLHCDPTASHYLKLLMDSIFGKKNFRNEIVWQRYGSHNDSGRYGCVTDTVFYYASAGATWNTPRLPLTEEDIARRYTYKDKRGLYTTSPLHARTLAGGGYGYTWKGLTDVWKFPQERLLQLEQEGRIHWPKKGKVPRRKVYLTENLGKPLSNLWVDIGIVSGKERTGYPTQKPLALLRRIIDASSNVGDVVLDPFCGCATACIAAEQQQRQWVGIDIGEKAADLVRDRMKRELGLFYQGAHRTRPPERTDLGKVIRYNDAKNKRHLYGEQGGFCNGCEEHFQPRNLTVDHIIPRAKGGTDHISNLQLLCGACNSMKGTRSQEYLLACLTDKGWIKRQKAA